MEGKQLRQATQCAVCGKALPAGCTTRRLYCSRRCQREPERERRGRAVRPPLRPCGHCGAPTYSRMTPPCCTTCQYFARHKTPKTGRRPWWQPPGLAPEWRLAELAARAAAKCPLFDGTERGPDFSPLAGLIA